MLFILIIILGGIGSMFGYWWFVIPICMVLNFFLAKSGKEAFGISAAAVIALWVGYATYLHMTADIDLIQKIAGIFSSGIPALAKIPAAGLVFSIISLIAGLIGGFGGLSGYSIKSLELTV